MKENLTYIQVDKNTRTKLQDIKIVVRETHNEIILRLIKFMEDNK